MSRSYRRSPVLANTCAESEKRDKVESHRSKRASFRELLASVDEQAFRDGILELFDERNRAHSDVNSHAKDGKAWHAMRTRGNRDRLEVMSAPEWAMPAAKAKRLMSK